MFGISQDPSFTDGCRKTNCDLIEFPAGSHCLEFFDEGFRAHSRPGIELSRLLTQHHEFDVSAADIDDERSLVHDRTGGGVARNLVADADRAGEALQDAFAFRLGRRTGRPAFDNFKSDEPE